MACVQKTSPRILALPGWDDASPSSASSAGVTLQGSRAKEEGSTGWRAEGGALAGEQIFQTLTLCSHLPEPIQEPGPSLSRKFSGPWGPMRLWMLGPLRSCLDNPFSQVWEEREGTCKRTGFWDAGLPLGMLASLRSPVPSGYTISEA